MINSIYEEIGQITDAEEMEATLQRIGRSELFEPIKNYPFWFNLMKYILHSYSIESDYTSLGDNWETTKRRIADIVDLPKNRTIIIHEGLITEKEVQVIDGVTSLLIPEVNKVINDYMDDQDDREFTHLISLKETYQMFLKSPFRDIDDDQMFKNMVNAKKLLEEIRDFEETVKQKWATASLGDARKEVTRNSKRKTTLLLHERIS